jgi:hypothetical protein
MLKRVIGRLDGKADDASCDEVLMGLRLRLKQAVPLLVLTSACVTGSSGRPAGASMLEQPYKTTLPDHDPRLPYTLNERLAMQIRGFGGAFVDETGRVSIYLTDRKEQAAAEHIVRTELSRMRRSDRIRFLVGRYRYIELMAIEKSLPDLGRGLSAYGIDDSRNRYLIQAETAKDLKRIKSTIRKAGLDIDKFLFEVAPRATVIGVGP